MPTNVLILGAGASAHYAFPVSREIWNRICVSKADLGDPRLTELALPPSAFKSFAERLAYSGVLSVDAFAEYLMDDRDDLYMAKGLIAYTLGLFEVRGTLPGRDRNWYRTLANALIGLELDTFPCRDIAIITFNYERSLERYLFDCLLGRFTRKHGLDELIAAFKRLPIIHIYGQMGALPEFEERGDPMRPYEQILNADQLALAISGMHLLSEIKRDATVGHRDAARHCLRKAFGNVTFLGFAYDPENLKALDLANTHGGKNVYGTTVGFGPNDPTEKLNTRMQRDFGVQWHPYATDMDVFAVLESFPDRTLGPEIGSESAPSAPEGYEEVVLEPDAL
jgi:hypothetical protein